MDAALDRHGIHPSQGDGGDLARRVEALDIPHRQSAILPREEQHLANDVHAVGIAVRRDGPEFTTRPAIDQPQDPHVLVTIENIESIAHGLEFRGRHPNVIGFKPVQVMAVLNAILSKGLAGEKAEYGGKQPG